MFLFILFQLINNTSDVINKHDIGPYNLDFEISGYSSTGLLIKNVKILSKDKNNQPKKWLRYITISDTYIFKSWVRIDALYFFVTCMLFILLLIEVPLRGQNIELQ